MKRPAAAGSGIPKKRPASDMESVPGSLKKRPAAALKGLVPTPQRRTASTPIMQECTNEHNYKSARYREAERLARSGGLSEDKVKAASQKN